MVIEGDFVPGVATVKSKPQSGYNVFVFPSINGSPASVVGGGDTVMMFKDTPASEALINYLATPEAAEIWTKRGGFSSPNKNVRRPPTPIDHAYHGDGARQGEHAPVRHVRPPAGLVRRHRRPG
jgi:ABC-type glycerol-3-phosphate transport system substrate-binding protein